MERECWFHDWVTGDRIHRLYPDGDSSWYSTVSGVDTSTLNFVAEDQGFKTRSEARAQFQDLFDADRRIMVVSSGDHIESATHVRNVRYKMSEGVFTVTGKGPRIFAAERSTFGVANYVDGDLLISNRSASGAVKAITDRFMQWSAQWKLLIDVVADGAGDITEDVKKEERVTIESLYARVEKRGYEMGLRPYFTSSYGVRWQQVVAPKITYGTPVPVPLSVDKAQVSGVEMEDNSDKRYTGLFYVGGGHGEDNTTVFSQGVGGRPVRDSFLYSKDVGDAAALQQISDGTFAETNHALSQTSAGFPLGERYTTDQISPGRILHFNIADDWWRNDGTYAERIISVRGVYGEESVDPEVQPYG